MNTEESNVYQKMPQAIITGDIHFATKKSLHGSANTVTVNTQGPSSKRSECRHLGLKNNSEVDYKLQQTKSVNPNVSLIERSRKWRRDTQLSFLQTDIRTCQCVFKTSPPYLEHILRTNVCQCDDQPLSRPPKQPPDECLERNSSAAQLGKWQSTDYSTRLMGDSRPTQHLEDCHLWTQGLSRILGDRRPPGQPPDHYHKSTTEPLDSSEIMGDGRQSPDHCHKVTTEPVASSRIMGDRRTPGEPPDHYYKWTSQFLDLTRVMGDGRPPGEPPAHEGKSHMMDYIRVMGDGRTPGEPPDHCHEGTSQLLDPNAIRGMHLPPRRPSTEYQADASLTLLKGTSGNNSAPWNK